MKEKKLYRHGISQKKGTFGILDEK
jgi:hypothetical protein